MIYSLQFFSWLTLFYMFMCFSLMSYVFIDKSNMIDSNYYNIGPHDVLYVFGIKINNYKMYIGLVFFSLVNIIFKEINQDVINSWLINHVQNIESPKNMSEIKTAMFINCVFTIYTWFDWFISINMITTQIDLLFIECLFNIIITIISTKIYYQKSPRLEN